MTIIILFPFLKPRELATFCQLNKACLELMLKYVNYQVLVQAWGINLTPADVEETRISRSRALQMAAKYMVLKSIIESPRIIGKEASRYVTRT